MFKSTRRSGPLLLASLLAALTLSQSAHAEIKYGVTTIAATDYYAGYRLAGNGDIVGGAATGGSFFYVRPAGRTHLEVKVLYSPGEGKS
ncbi:hypothetical protein [Duganella violaceipulchra]|uniref:Porin n=1 Tax=Duganella violaceipulchra TaxID=2849652 RepID=A0AA41H8Y5_9BURK|nr:hypothetical protein [Duganella violaceicalia]MBV6320462.1 hypothetical protein [Duganella violaceicalia]MCP2008830.1 hypothetical protein [Duganella violaceicalia]